MTLFTSLHKKLRTSRNYLFLSIFFALFGAIYEHFSFGVYSNYMIYAFAAPLVLGALPFLLLALREIRKRREDVLSGEYGLVEAVYAREDEGSGADGHIARQLWHAGVLTLTIGSIFRGVLDIYGTASPLNVVYFIAGPALLAAALIAAAVQKSRIRQLHCRSNSASAVRTDPRNT